MTTDFSSQSTTGALRGLERLWFRLIEPSVSVPDIERRHQLRLISGFALASTLLGFILGVVITPLATAPDNPFGSPIFLPGLISSILPLVIYFQSRAGRFHLAAVMLIAVAILGPWASSISYPNMASIMLIGVLFAFLFLPGLGVIVTAGVSLLLMLLLPVIRPEISLEVVLPLAEALFIVSALFYVARRHLDSVAKEQRAVLEGRNEAFTRQAKEIDKVFRAASMGNFDARAEIFGDDEIARAAEGVNAMLGQLNSLIHAAESERATFMESFTGVVALTDMEGSVTYMNLAGAQMAGYDDPGKIIGVKQFSELISPEYLQLTMEVGVPTAIEKGSWASESNLLMLDGSIIPVDQTIFVVRDEQGKPRNLGILMTDISAHKLAEAQLAAQNEALNNALEELRKLITDVDFAAQQMAGASEAIVNVVSLLAGQASTSAQMAEKAASSAKSGDEAVASTISAMGRIRESTQETTRRIKRLGEASQEIGEVVRLIDEVADRVTVLALNASIQAAAAGEAGRGFAVVAEEVQRLAERATNATRQIENMVKSIQGEINEAMIGVEEATREVVDGSQLAQSAGERITDLNLAIGELSDLIQHVSDTTAQQTTEALASLAALAADLQASVSALEIPAEPSQISGNGGGRTAAQLGGMIES